MTKIGIEPIRIAISTEITQEFTRIGSPISNVGSSMYLKNTTDEPIFISLDGINAHFFIEAEESVTHYFTINNGTQIYQKTGPHSTPVDGALYLTIFYKV